MNSPTQQTSTPSDASTSTNGVTVVNVPSLEERSATIFDEQPGPASPETPVVAPDAAAAARAERRAKYETLLTEERARVDAQSKHRESADLRKKLEDAERRAEAAKGHIDPSKLDEAAFFDMATKLNVTPQKLGEWLREQVTNPERAAALAASTAIDPKLAAFEAKIAEQQKVIDEFLGKQQSAQADAEERHYVEQFHAFTRENVSTSPYAARFLDVHGAEEYAKLAQAAAATVPPGAGAQAILDEVEERLTQLAKIYAPQGVPQQRRAPTLPNPAAAKAPTTVSNTLAQTRASVVNEDDDWAALPFEERSARLFR